MRRPAIVPGIKYQKVATSRDSTQIERYVLSPIAGSQLLSHQNPSVQIGNPY
ncbi:MAG: hypothetical protein R2830_15680 [Saprospiraceae bacterium]